MGASDRRVDLGWKVRQRWLSDAVSSIRRGERPAAPAVVDLDPTTFCDFGCPECISEPVLRNGAFSNDRLHALVAELADAGVRAVIFIGGGEPLLHRGTVPAMQLLARRGVHVGLVTNGYSFGDRVRDVAGAASWVRVSVDAASADTYAAIRPRLAGGGSAFDTVISNLRSLAEAGGCDVGYSFLVIRRRPALIGGVVGRALGFTNVREIPAAAALARDIGCRYVELKAEMQADHSLSPWLPDERDELRDLVGQAEGHSIPGTFDVLVSESLRAVCARPAAQRKRYDRCAVARLRCTITPQGTFPCAYHRGVTRFRTGDVVEDGFPEVWSRADLDVVVPSRDCGFHCARHEQNVYVWETAEGPSVDGYDPFV